MPVEEEETEILKLIELKHATRDEKRAIETETATEGGDAVVLFERTWRRTAPETLHDVEDAVDALDLDRLRRRALEPAPDEDAAEAEEEPRFLPQSDDALQKGADAGGEALTPLATEREEAVANFVRGELTRAVVVYRTTGSEIVEVTFTRDGEEHQTLLHIKGNRIRDLDTIHRDVDAFEREEEQSSDVPPTPTREDLERAEREVPPVHDIDEPSSPDTAPTADDIGEEIEIFEEGMDEPHPAPAAEEESEDERLRHELEDAELEVPAVSDVDEAASPEVAPAADDIERELEELEKAPPAEKKGLRGRLPFGRKKDDDEEDADAAAQTKGSKGLTDRLPFGRKGRKTNEEDAADAGDAADGEDATAEDAEAPDEEPAKKGGLATRLGIKRKK